MGGQNGSDGQNVVPQGSIVILGSGTGPAKNEPEKRESASSRPSTQSKVRPTTVRAVLLRRKSYIVLRARIRAPFKAHTKEITKEVARPKAASPLLWWRPKAATFVCALNGASILALSTIYDLRLSKTGRTVVGRTFDWMDGRSDAVSRLSGSFLNGYYLAQKTNGQPPHGFNS